jgi:photosystem II stability/assembly factor-like uncharacterized protein
MVKQLNLLVIFVFILLLAAPADAQVWNKKKMDDAAAKSAKKLPTSSSLTYPDELYSSLNWRNIGPYRGGRSCAVTGVAGKPMLFYMGSAGGGVWKTVNGGQTWSNISDGYFGGSIGSIAVSEWDNNVIYVGGGEKTVRGNVSYGYGIWKTEDGGKTWKHVGLKNSRHISRIRIHPKNPNVAYAAVMGDLYKSSKERGVYKTTNGGETWEKVLFANADAGATDLIIDPTNPKVLYASTWRIRRTPYSLSSGGEGSALWKSTDEGSSWTNISENKGMPKLPHGIIGVAVSPVKQDRVWAIVESPEGGVFRSEDGGENWTKINSERKLRQRAWYYTRIYADTKDENTVYVMNVRFHKSVDGGKSFKSKRTPHGDHHDLWISPENPDNLIVGDDGGAQITYDGGANWSTYMNQPTSQFYRVTTDNAFPYRIYVAQQDNSTIRIPHRTSAGSISEDDWESTAGGESAHIAIDPTNNDIVYGGSYDGFLTRYNHKTEEIRAINVWPDNPMGHGAEGMRYRFQWNFPIFFSPHDAKKLYTGSNHLHVSHNEGQSWEIISPDLTRNDSTKLKSSGGPITQDNTSVEYYCTIFAATESPREKDLIWVGSDDGLVHITRDGGKNWDNVTPKNMPEWIMINSIDVDPFVDGGAYIAATMYKSGNYEPYLYKTKDYGKTWTKITNGIDKGHFTRVVRADPTRKGLLYTGTESGMYVSFDDGANWKSFQMNLPIVPITDLTIKEGNLIAATQGRSIWMIDDLSVLYQLDNFNTNKESVLFQPKHAYRMKGWQSSNAGKTSGANHPSGVLVNYYLKTYDEKKDTILLTFLDNNGQEIVEYSTHAEEKNRKLKVKEKGNTFSWNLRYPDATGFDGMINWWASLNGPKAVPGNYNVRLTVNGEAQQQRFRVLKDPRSSSSNEDLQAQFDFLISLRDKVTETHETIKNIRSIRNQLNTYNKRLADDEAMKEVIEQSKKIIKELTAIEKTLYQTKNRSGQDPLNFPIRLNNKLAHLNSLVSIGDFRPTAQDIAVKDELTKLIDEQLAKYKTIVETDIPALNKAIKAKEVDAIFID